MRPGVLGMDREKLTRRVKTTMLWTDLGFLGYWVATSLGLVSVGTNRFLLDWNWSFLMLDLLAIGSGLTSLALSRRGSPASDQLMTVSLALTGAAGLMALNFYALRCEFDLAWWLPNLWLFGFGAVSIALLALTTARGTASPTARS